jgi:hypothetical protein
MHTQVLQAEEIDKRTASAAIFAASIFAACAVAKLIHNTRRSLRRLQNLRSQRAARKQGNQDNQTGQCKWRMRPSLPRRQKSLEPVQ